MSPLRTALTEYLTLRRALGFKLADRGDHPAAVRPLCRTGGGPLDHHGPRLALGDPTAGRPARPLGHTPRDGPRLCPILPRARRPD